MYHQNHPSYRTEYLPECQVLKQEDKNCYFPKISRYYNGDFITPLTEASMELNPLARGSNPIYSNPPPVKKGNVVSQLAQKALTIEQPHGKIHVTKEMGNDSSKVSKLAYHTLNRIKDA